MITAGVDIGSTTSKAVLLEKDRILGQAVINNKSLPAESAGDVFEKCCAQSGVHKKAIEAMRDIGAKGLLGQASLDLGLLHTVKGRTDEARECLSEAIRLFKQCEAEGYLKRAKEALASLG